MTAVCDRLFSGYQRPLFHLLSSHRCESLEKRAHTTATFLHLTRPAQCLFHVSCCFDVFSTTRRQILSQPLIYSWKNESCELKEEAMGMPKLSLPPEFFSTNKDRRRPGAKHPIFDINNFRSPRLIRTWQCVSDLPETHIQGCSPTPVPWKEPERSMPCPARAIPGLCLLQANPVLTSSRD